VESQLLATIADVYSLDASARNWYSTGV